MAVVTYLLLVTWFTMAGGASSYQVAFDSRELCEQAAAALVQDQDRLRQHVAGMFSALPSSAQAQGTMPAMESMMGPMLQGMTQPFVSAVCVEQ